MSHHCPDKQTFISLVKSKTPQEYEIKKQSILESHGSLANYLNQKSRWVKISRFESDFPRDLCIASTTAESLNALIAKLHLKNKEPLEVLMNIYDIGFFAIKNICLQTGILTESIDEWLDYAMTVAHHLTVIQSPLYLWKFEVYKEGDAATKYTVIIIPSETP